MDEARSVSYSINVRANTSQAEASIRNVTSSLGALPPGMEETLFPPPCAPASAGLSPT